MLYLNHIVSDMRPVFEVEIQKWGTVISGFGPLLVVVGPLIDGFDPLVALLVVAGLETTKLTSLSGFQTFTGTHMGQAADRLAFPFGFWKSEERERLGLKIGGGELRSFASMAL